MPSIYHITHVDNLAGIAAEGLCSDAVMLRRGGPNTAIGMSAIKQRRLTLPVKCHPGDSVGDCVPFYFCPRSIMLYLIYMANHPDLTYRGGQGPIVHLEADMEETVEWAESEGLRWSFTLSNAGAVYTEFRNDLNDLGEVDWPAVRAIDFRDAQVKEGKQAEFLVMESFPWELVRRVGVRTAEIQATVQAALDPDAHCPPVDIRPDWYF
jgi:ssDNA thymidine ADP-ribosyltransferase DarT-like protein